MIPALPVASLMPGPARYAPAVSLAVLATVLLSTGGARATSAQAQEHKAESGLLECRGAPAVAYGFGSTRRVVCEFRPSAGVNQYYTGTLERAGIDFGVSDQGSMLWMVVATTTHLGPAALAGQYVGITSGIALGPGFSANMLVAKDASTGISLQPLSVSADSGLSISLAGATLTLDAASGPQRL
jgi:hypothetical protein